jgi:hypothetical protein
MLFASVVKFTADNRLTKSSRMSSATLRLWRDPPNCRHGPDGSLFQSRTDSLALSYDPNSFVGLTNMMVQPIGMNLGTGDSAAVSNLASESFQRSRAVSDSTSTARTESRSESPAFSRALKLPSGYLMISRSTRPSQRPTIFPLQS